MEETEQESVEIKEQDGTLVGFLYGFDSHGTGRQNKLWVGHILGDRIELRNLREVKVFAKSKGLKVGKHL